MFSLRAAFVVGIAALLGTRLTTCRSPGEGGSEPSPGKSGAAAANVNLKGVDTSELTSREKAEWSRYVTDFLAPCPEHPVSLAQCVNEARSCKACVPAARFLMVQARRGNVRSQVEAIYRARFSPEAVKNIDVSGAPAKGAASGSVLIAEWADFECPACEGMRTILDKTLEKYPNDVRLVFKHFPLSNHPNAEKAARAAVAAQKQNRFWEMHKGLFDKQEDLSAESIDKLAREIGLDLKRFSQDRDSEATADQVARDRKHGEALEIRSTPSLFINGRPFPPGKEPQLELEEWIKLELELVGPSPAAQPTRAAAPQPAVSAPPAPSGGATKAPASSAKPGLGTTGAKPAPAP